MHEIFNLVKFADEATIREAIAHDPQCVSAVDENELPALYTAALHRNAGVVDVLIESGANVDIFACGYLDRPDDASFLLRRNKHLVKAALPGNRTALHFACQKGSEGVARLLIDHGADINAADNKGNTPLSEAAHGGPWKAEAHDGIIALLIERGAKVDFWLAAEIGRAELLETLLPTASVDAVDANGYTALYHAAHNNHRDCVRMLISAGADVNLKCEDGQTALSTAALHLLSQQCDPELCRELIAAGASYDIHTAAALNDVKRLRELLDSDKNLISSSIYGMRPADYAVHCGHLNALRLLLEAGVDPNAVDDHGHSLRAKSKHLPDLHQLLIEYLERDA